MVESYQWSLLRDLTLISCLCQIIYLNGSPLFNPMPNTLIKLLEKEKADQILEVNKQNADLLRKLVYLFLSHFIFILVIPLTSLYHFLLDTWYISFWLSASSLRHTLSLNVLGNTRWKIPPRSIYLSPPKLYSSWYTYFS